MMSAALQTFSLAAEYVDAEAERGLIAAVAGRPSLRFELADLLPPGVIAVEPEVWAAVADACEKDTPAALPEGWSPVADPQATAQRLADLYQRRQVAEEQARLAKDLRSEKPMPQVLADHEAGIARIQSTVREFQGGRLLLGSDLAQEVLADAEARKKQRDETGRPVMGLPFGLKRLDEITGGLNPGLYVLGGPPGGGKTTLSVQVMTCVAAAGTPVVYVSYENSPANIVQKALCAKAGVSPRDVDRGTADLKQLRVAAFELRDALSRLAVVGGTAKLTLAEVRARAMQMMNRWKSSRVLLIFDYLQRAAHGQGHDQLRHNVSALAGELRDLSTRLDSPVLVLSSQNRTGYGDGKASSNLATLKESGDLEYTADVVLFLTPSEKRTATPPALAVDLSIEKNRYGESNVRVPLIFKRDIGALREEAHR